MNKIIKLIAGIGIISFVVFGLWQVPAVRAGVQALNIFQTSNPAGNSNSTTIGSSTVTYMTAGTGTSTLSFNTTTSNQEQIFVDAFASSTATQFNWQYEFSNDNVNWFEEDQMVVPNLATGIANVDHASTTVTHRWVPGTTSTSSKAVLLPNIASKYTRVRFFIPIGGAAGAVWVQAVAQAINPN